MKKADHSGHRSRMRKKLVEKGLEFFEPHEVLEILLYYAIPQRNTNGIAKNLIDRFGSLASVLDAPEEELMDAGLTDYQIQYIKMYPIIMQMYLNDKYHNSHMILNENNINDFFIRQFSAYADSEVVLLVLLDPKRSIKYCGVIANSHFSIADISVGTITELAVKNGAVSAIIAHNRIRGSSLPSQQDVKKTIEIKRQLELVKVYLIDHYLITNSDCISFAECGLI